jgi:hypothetical protein
MIPHRVPDPEQCAGHTQRTRRVQQSTFSHAVQPIAPRAPSAPVAQLLLRAIFYPVPSYQALSHTPLANPFLTLFDPSRHIVCEALAAPIQPCRIDTALARVQLCTIYKVWAPVEGAPRCVPVVAVEPDCHVNIDNVAVLQRAAIRDAVADTLVHTRADTLWEGRTTVSQG